MNLIAKYLPALTVFISSITGFALAQDYIPFTDDPAKEKLLTESISKRHQQDQSGLTGKNKKQVGELYKERYEMIKKKIDENELIVNLETQSYLDQLAQEILRYNKNLVPADLRIQFSRSIWPNASSMGEGTIIFNIGLFSRLRNEAQAAFVICHELAHYSLNHSNNAIQQYVQTVNSDEFQRELKEIRNNSYRQNAAVEKLALRLSFGSRRHSREHEQAADSLAIEFMKPTSFDVSEAVTTLALLDSVDKEKYDCDLQLETTFNFPEYPFKKKWLTNNTLSLTETREEAAKKKKLEDSLKTHPDCKHRIELIAERATRYTDPTDKKFVVDEKKFGQLRSSFDYEAINYEFESGEVSHALYNALQMLHYFPNDAYLMAMVGKCLNRIYEAQATHELGKITDLPNPGYNEQYNNLLKLLQNLRLPEVGSLAYYYLKMHQDTGKSSEEYIAALIKSKDNFGKPEEKKEWIDYYESHFSKRKYKF